MKTLAFSLIILINTIQFSTAQNHPNKANQVSISTETEDSITTLYWESNREVNSSYYLIEKSMDGKTFEKVGTQQAGSSTYQTTNYSFEDVENTNGFAQYRITLVLMDGNTLSTLSEDSFNENITEAIAK